MSQQSTPDDGGGIAAELAEDQRAISIAEFFEKNKHMLGFDSGARALVTAVKEGVDNALDAAEEAEIPPDIYVEITEEGDYYRLVIEDNGPGITKEQLPNIFGKLLYGSRFHKREQSLPPEQTLLVRRDGVIDQVPIGVLCDAYLPDDGAGTAPVSGDIEVPSFNRDTHEMSWQPVTHAIRHETDEPVYEITTETGRTVAVTGNHSLFSLTKDGTTAEVNAAALTEDDVILAPQTLPGTEAPINSINLLESLQMAQIEGRRVYVDGFETATLEQITHGEVIDKRPSPGSEPRPYYRYNGVDIPQESFETEYRKHGYLPAETVIELGWEQQAADAGCVLRIDQGSGENTEMPVALSVSKELMQLLAHAITGEHDNSHQDREIGGRDEAALVDPIRQASAGPSAETTVARQRAATRDAASGSPLALLCEGTRGTGVTTKQIPAFVFRVPPADQRSFLAALYNGDETAAQPGAELSYTTASKRLARQLSALWNMQGVVASTERITDDDGGSTTGYRVTVSGDDAALLNSARDTAATGTQGSERVPTTLLADVAVRDVDQTTVPDSIPGLLAGVGLGSTLDAAAEYQSVIEATLDGATVDPNKYVTDLQELGLLAADGTATAALRDLWETVHHLQGVTDSDLCLLSVQEVKTVTQPEYVYDISVPGVTGRDENFVVLNDGALAVKNSRGQQGIGISAAVLYAQLTSGKPAKITSRPKGTETAQYFELIVDTDTNEPEIRVEEETTWDRPHGTRIELELDANMRARQQLHEYIRRTAVVNPHTRIELREPGLAEPMKFDRAADQLPEPTEEIRPHPHGVELGTLLKMLEATDSRTVSGFLQSEFTRVGRKTARSIIDAFKDRHFGRAMTWPAPEPHEDVDVASVVIEATANKPADATDAFGAAVADSIVAADRLGHHDVTAAVDAAAETVGAEYNVTFGATVQENVIEAVWSALTTPERLRAACYREVDAVTTARKADATINGLAERLADLFESPERHRLTRAELESRVDRAADRTETHDDATIGATARENIVDALWDRTETVPDDPPTVATIRGDRDTASELLDAMHAVNVLAPPTSCLSPISDGLVEAGLKKVYDAEFFAAATRDAEVHGGDPFIAEAGIAYGGALEDGPADVLRFANRVPLVYQRGACAITDVIKDIGWRNYELDQPGGSGLPNAPVVIMVHVASTNVPFTSESKDAVANVPEIEHEIELAVREAARELKSHLKQKRSRKQRQRKQNQLADILPAMASKLAGVTERPEPNYGDALARIMNNLLIERAIEADGETQRVVLTVENHTSGGESFEVTEIVNAEPTVTDEGATVVELDGEWFIKWPIEVESGDTVRLEYHTAAGADVDLSVDGIEQSKLTVSTNP